jgi:hypothetical protein
MAINSVNGSTLLESGFFPPVRVASTGSPLNPSVGGLLTVDGIALAAGDRVLCKDEASAVNNGIYAAATGPWVRTSDASGNQQFFIGMAVVVGQGSVNGGAIFICSCTDNPVIVGTSLITFAKITSFSGNQLSGAIEYVIDGLGQVVTTGVKGYLEVPFNCTINRATLLADRSGSAVVDVWRCTYAQFDGGATHPVAADKITASAPPTISSATKAQDTTLSGWTTSLNAGDILAFNVNSASAIQRLTLSLKLTKQ